MEPQRFDALTRSFVDFGSRRRLLGGLVGAALAGLPGRVFARRCTANGHVCREHANCCSGFCSARNRLRRRTCAPCASGITCGSICCPPETVGCTSQTLPNGTVLVGCLCPSGLNYERERNACVDCSVCRPRLGCCAPFGRECGEELPCCSGVCDRGTCRCAGLGEGCDEQYDCCEGGACVEGTCQQGVNDGICQTSADCGPAFTCIGGECVLCSSGDTTTNTDGIVLNVTDCPWSMSAYVCIPSVASGYPGYGFCCIPGENCHNDPCAYECPTDTYVSGTAQGCYVE